MLKFKDLSYSSFTFHRTTRPHHNFDGLKSDNRGVSKSNIAINSLRNVRKCQN